MAAKGSERGAAVDLHALGARVVSVFGPFGSRVFIEMSAEAAAPLFPDGLAGAGERRLIDAVERDLDLLRKRSASLAESALAASALALAAEIEHPFNSATSKSMCAKALYDALRELRELAPAEEEEDQLDDLSARRAARIAGGAAT